LTINAKCKCQCVLLTVQFLFFIVPTALGQNQQSPDRQDSSKPGERIHIPNRAPNPLFQGRQGKEKTEIHFDPATGVVTMKLLVQDPSGYFIPNIRRENFAVYESGERQQIETVEVEHPPVSLGLMLEFGGRVPGFNRVLSEHVSNAGRQLLEVVGHPDKIAIWKYNNKLEKIADFSQPHDVLESLFYSLGTPEVSETNLYDALILALDQMGEVSDERLLSSFRRGLIRSARLATRMR